MVKHRIGITRFADSVSAVAFDLPGCATTAGTQAELDAVLPVVLAEYLAWTESHGERLTTIGASAFDVGEVVDATMTDAQDGEFCFEDDLRPVTDADLSTGLRLMAHSRADLLAAADRLPGAVRDWRPPRSAMARVDPWKPHPLTIREILADAAGAESYYRHCLADGPIAPDPEGERNDLALQRDRVISALRSLAGADRGRLFRPQTPWGAKPEHWTARKALRRIIGHERFHTAEIRQRLSWLLLGVPEFRDVPPDSS